MSLFDFLYKEIESYNVDTDCEGEAEDGENCQAENSKAGKRKLTPGLWICLLSDKGQLKWRYQSIHVGWPNNGLYNERLLHISTIFFIHEFVKWP